MLFIKMIKIDLTGGHIEIMLIIEIAKIEILLCIEIAKLELTRGLIKIMLIIEICQIRISRRPY